MKKANYVLLAVSAALLTACGGSNTAETKAGEYAVRTVEAQDASLQTTYPATIKGQQDVEIRPKISGFITELRVNEGDIVTKGQLLFVIDKVTYEAAVEQANAAVKAAESQLGTAKLTYENNLELYNNNVIGDFELQSSKNNYDAAEASLLQAKANYVSAKQNLGFCYITSPSNGIVGDLPYKVGALVSASSAEPLTTISNVSTLNVYFSMTEKDLLELSKTAGGLHAAISAYPPVQLQLADGSIYEYEGKVAAVSGVVDQTTGSVSIRADFQNPNGVIKSGASGSIIVPHVSEGAVVIPQEAVVAVQDKNFIYKVGEDNKVVYSQITIDPNDDGQNYIVTSGLEVGETYVVKGITSLVDGMEITPVTEEKYEQNIKDAEAMGADQADLGKLKEDFAQ